jgi:UDP-2,4-diacetamido-2,4,6-trideoxy-beta-L-altropyranose hydrolase
MRIVFRTDASVQIGIGHVMRCLTLADALRANGADCRFICREHPGNLLKQIRQRGYAALGLPVSSDIPMSRDNEDVAQSNHSAWLGSDWATDAAQTKVGAGETAVDWLIVDHYALDVRWERALRSMCRKLMVIDDLADRHHDCDLLLDQNLGRDATDYGELVPKDCAVLAGSRYALLRPEFAAQRDYSLHRRAIPKLEHLLITMGGVDQVDATGQILEMLMDCRLPEDCHITVVMGPHAPWLARVTLLAEQMPRPTEVKVNVHNMAELMADSDVAIGAAGSTSWERCCLGLPSLIGVFADNQRSIANALQLAGAAKEFGGMAGVAKINRMVTELFDDEDALASMSAYAAGVTDGCGTERVAARLLAMGPI